jgi:serine/threonine protein kinase
MAASDAAKKPRHLGRYELVEKLGSGGMGSVYKAREQDKEGFVALKVANRTVAGNSILSQRFHNEFKVASALRHPNLVRALEFGVEDKVPYLVMEFVPGISLEKRIKEQGPLPLAEALAIFAQVAAALDYVHENHLVHRDIKPGNVLIDLAGHAKLTDFGLIKDLDSQAMLTNSRTGLGTLEYAAPEQFDDAKHVDLRCDIYALAASLYVALTGKFPFGAASPMKVLMHKLDHQFKPMAEIVDGINPALDQMIICALHPNPDLRPNRIADFLAGMRGADFQVSKPMKTPLRPKPPEPPTPAVEKRRGGPRYPVATMFGTLKVSDRDSWPAQVLDISAKGLCLQIPRRFEANALLNLSLPDGDSGRFTSHKVRICWVKPQPDNSWLYGCLFVNPLANEHLDRFLVKDSAPTSDLHGLKSPP